MDDKPRECPARRTCRKELLASERAWANDGEIALSPTSSAPTWQSPHGRTLPPIGRRTLIMGILNVTPDSFSDGGELPSLGAIVTRARQMVAAGADVLDIGGESTRPGAVSISAEEEFTRVLPAVEAVRQALPEVPISIDSFKPAVVEAAIGKGADIINDVWGLAGGMSVAARESALATLRSGGTGLPLTAMAETAARLRCPVILMHNRPNRDYGDFWDDVILDLRLSLGLAERAGVARHQLWLDPGFGFAKDVPQNLEVLARLEKILALGCPLLVGTSRKSTIGKVLGADVDDRIEGTGATVVWAIQQGAQMIRVHDVAPMVRFARMADAIKLGIAYSTPPA
jgi:dihydropteroate synthase